MLWLSNAVTWVATHSGEICLGWVVLDKVARKTPWTQDDTIVGLLRAGIKKLVGKDPAKALRG